MPHRSCALPHFWGFWGTICLCWQRVVVCRSCFAHGQRPQLTPSADVLGHPSWVARGLSHNWRRPWQCAQRFCHEFLNGLVVALWAGRHLCTKRALFVSSLSVCTLG